MSFIKELTWRGMIHQTTPGVEELFGKEQVTAYIGFDPTAPSMTIGNYVQIMLLKILQDNFEDRKFNIQDYFMDCPYDM